jgi:hypothetical protein
MFLRVRIGETILTSICIHLREMTIIYYNSILSKRKNECRSLDLIRNENNNIR